MHCLKFSTSICIIVALATNFAAAQQSEPASKPIPANASQEFNPEQSKSSSTPSGLTVDETRTLINDDGEPVEIPNDATLKNFLDWLKLQKGEAYHISEIQLEGNANAERANLTATIKVIVHREQEEVEVPLGLNEAVLRKFKHVGKGDHQPVIPFDREKGHRWRFRGKGEHQLTLSMIVPLLKPVPARRLLLQIPPTAVSSLNLNVPVPLERLSSRPPLNSHMTKKAVGKESSELEVVGLGSVLDLQWETLPDKSEVDTVLQSKTLITLGLAEESLLLEATQTITAVQGSFSEVTVTLPPGFDLLRVSGKEYRDRQIHNDNRVTVQLTEQTSGSIELNWTLEKNFPFQGNQLSLQGFAIDGDHARDQEGTIEIKAIEGFRITRTNRQEENRFVRRIDVRDLNRSGSFTLAYTFRQQPFQLTLQVTEIEPKFRVEPHLFARITPEVVELDATFHFHVLAGGGAVKQVELHWPNRKDEGWEIDPIDSLDVFGSIDMNDNTAGDTVLIPLVRAMTEPFEISLKARRSISRDRTNFNMTLPSAAAAQVLPTVLVVAGDDNIVFRMVPIDGTKMVSLPNDIRSRILYPVDFPELNRSDYHIDSRNHSFQTSVSLYEQSIHAESTATLRVLNNQLRVRQRMSFDVSYERLDRIQVISPIRVGDRINFLLNEDLNSDDNLEAKQGISLSPNWVQQGAEEPWIADIRLPEARIGKFDVVAEYQIDLPEVPSAVGPASVDVLLPLVESSDTDYSTVRIRFHKQDQINLTIPDEDWKEQLFVDSTTPSWVADQPNSEIPLQLTHTISKSRGDYAIEHALIRSEFEQDGRARSQGRYWIVGDISSLIVTIPKDVIRDGIWWNKTPLGGKKILETPPGSGRYRFDVSDLSENRENLLTIGFHSRNDSALSWHQNRRLSAPEFPPNVWIDQTVWELILPYNQHLFLLPQGFTPQFHWQREMFFWRRKANVAFAEMDNWLAMGEGPPELKASSEGNTYPFSRIGPASSMQFAAMSQSVVVLFGAGLTLAIGFLLLKLPMTRNILTLLIVAFIMAFLGIWFAAPIQLLLQPAILGLLLAIAAVLIDGSLKKKGSSTSVLSLSAPSDFLLPSASSFVEHAGGSGSLEAPTAVRQPYTTQEEPVSSSDASASE